MESLWCSLTLLLLGQLQPSHTHQNLSCFNDYINKVTCLWDSEGVLPDTACTLYGKHGDRSSECELKPLDGQDRAQRGCHLIFVKQSFFYWSVLSLEVKCENWTKHVVQIKEYEPRRHVKLYPPGMPIITGYNISWSPGSPFSDMMVDYAFQLQYKQKEQQWGDPHPVRETYMELNNAELVKGEHYQVRVRVIPSSEFYRGEWSLWSPVASWRSEVGREWAREATGHLTDTEKGLVIGCVGGLLVFLGFISITLPRHKCLNVVICKPVPDPSKYFDTLVSAHGGNFQKWLSPVFAAESYDFSHSEDISRVEVSNVKATDALFRKENATAPEQWDSSRQSFNFSNVSYFCSRYPYGVETCPVYFSYRPAEGGAAEGKDGAGSTNGNGPIQTCSSYKCLQKLVDLHREQKHPDSGIGEASEDQGDEREKEGGDGLKEACSHPSPFLPFLPPFGRSPSLVPFPRLLSGFHHFPFPLDLASQRLGALYPSSSGKLEPCGDGYMPVNVL